MVVDRKAQHPEQLRRAIRPPRACMFQLVRDRTQLLRLTLLQLDLDLDELFDDAERVHDRDVVDRHLGRTAVARHERSVPARAQLGDRRYRSVPEVRDEQLRDRLRRSCRPTHLLELEPGVAGRKLELPEAPSPLRAPAQRDPGVRQRAVGRVVVDRGEDPRLERLPAQVGELEAFGRVQLALVFGDRLHRRDLSLPLRFHLHVTRSPPTGPGGRA